MASSRASSTRYSPSMSRTSRGVALTWPVSMRETLEGEHSSSSATLSMVSPAPSRSRRSSAPRRRRRPVGVRVVIGAPAAVHSAYLQSLSASFTLAQERPFSTVSRGEGVMAASRPRERILDAATRLFSDEGFHGSYVANVATELRAWPGHPAQAAVAAHRAALRDLLRDLATDAGVPSPDEAALQLHMLIDGATAVAVV